VTSPAKLTVNQPHTATVDSYGTAYYYFTTLTSGTHTINLSTAQSADWVLYSDKAYTQSFNIPGTYYANCSTSSSAAGNCTTINLDAGVNYYLKVTNSSSTSAGCSITVSDGTGSEGSVASPVVLSEGVTYAGRIAGTVSYPYGTSYYKFTAGSSRPYMIMVTNVLSGGQNDIEWYMFGPGGFSSPAIGTVYSYYTFAGDAIAATSEFNPAVTLVAGTDYYLRVYNMNASNNSYNIKVFPYDFAAGCNAGGSCIDFESGIPVSPVFDLNPQTPIQNTATLPWAIDATTAATGTKSLKAGSTAPAGANKYPFYQSCFKFQATDVKWLDFSLSTQSSSSQDFLVFYLDGNINNGTSVTTNGPGPHLGCASQSA